jgi:methionyl-tRNA formyltransferase
MRVIMMGTGPFAVPTLRALYTSRHSVLALVTRPPRPVHGKSQAQVNPMRELAVQHGTRVHEPQNINTPGARAVLASYQSDLLVVCDYGQILAPETLEMARLGGINLHGSLLPKYRGAAPVQWAVYHGETETGATVIHMMPRVDAGPAIAQVRTPIGGEETAAELELRLSELGVPLVIESIDALEAGTAKAIPQDASQATRAPRLTKELGAVDWSRSAAAIANQVRALQPWPKTYTFWQRAGGAPLRLILEKVHVEPLASGVSPGATGVSPVSAAPGASGVSPVPAGPQGPDTIVKADRDSLLVATGDGVLAIDQLQPAGKRIFSTAEFLRGYSVRVGARFGP